jgi:hypothetical protein
MICQQCQTELREGARFCVQCATPVPEPQASPVSFEGVANLSTIQQSGTPTMENVGVRETHGFDHSNFCYWGGRNYRWEFTVIWISEFIFCGVGYFLLGEVFFLFSLPTIYIHIINVIRRFHDMGRSGWWFFLTLIPLVHLVAYAFLLFAPGDKKIQDWDI